MIGSKYQAMDLFQGAIIQPTALEGQLLLFLDPDYREGETGCSCLRDFPLCSPIFWSSNDPYSGIQGNFDIAHNF